MAHCDTQCKCFALYTRVKIALRWVYWLHQHLHDTHDDSRPWSVMMQRYTTGYIGAMYGLQMPE
eukprot:19308-Eustigmatos_ZCMA.PRE.1